MAALKDKVDEQQAQCAQAQDQKEDQTKSRVLYKKDKSKEANKDISLSDGPTLSNNQS